MELTTADMLLQAALSILAVIGAAIFVSGIVILSLLVEWHFFPLSRPGADNGANPQGFANLEGLRSNDNDAISNL